MDGDKAYLFPVASKDYEDARHQSFLNDMSAFLHGRGNDLLSFDEVQDLLPQTGQVDRGMQQAPLDAIRGSVDRYRDFDRNFLPRNRATRERWERLDRAALAGEYVPPVQLYKVGEVYFVKDGNHRVSVARQQGAQDIEAEVIESLTNVPLRPDTDLRELLRLAEYARFLQITRLDKLRPGVNIIFTSLGRYDELLEQISAHRWYMGIEQKRPISWEEAVLDWYDSLYLPTIRIIEESGILADFPGHTAADLYIWIMDHRYFLSLEKGQPVGSRTAFLSYDAHYGNWRRRMRRFLARLLARIRQPLIITRHGLRRALRATTSRMPHLLPLLSAQPIEPSPDDRDLTLPLDTNPPA